MGRRQGIDKFSEGGQERTGLNRCQLYGATVRHAWRRYTTSGDFTLLPARHGIGNKRAHLTTPPLPAIPQELASTARTAFTTFYRLLSLLPCYTAGVTSAAMTFGGSVRVPEWGG